MLYDFAALDGAQRYKLMSAAIVPRPIAWVSSLSADGVGNLAPYSFFNMMGASPPLVVLGTMRQTDGRLKDSAANIIATRDFIIHLVDEAHLNAMNLSCIDAPPEVDEAILANVETVGGEHQPKRIVTAPVAFECTLFQSIDAPPDTMILIGEVRAMHLTDAHLDVERLRIDPTAMGLIGRVHGPGAFVRVAADLQRDRPVYADWLTSQAKADSSP